MQDGIGVVSYPKSSSIKDITKHNLDNLATELYNDWVDTKEESEIYLEKYIFQPAIRSYDYILDSVKKSKDINEGLVLALVTSVAANFGITNLARYIPGIDSTTLHKISFLAESVSGSSVFISNFAYQRRKMGESYKTIGKELLRIGITGATVSYGPYQMIRGPTMDWLYNTSIPKYLVPLATQGLLFFPFMYAIDLLGKPMDYLNENRHKIIKKMNGYTNNINGNNKRKIDEMPSRYITQNILLMRYRL